MDSEEQRRTLLAYAENLPINDFPGFTHIMSTDSKYVRVSDCSLSLLGYKNQEQIFATDYYNMPCKASENAEAFEKEDILALSQEISILSYHQYNTGWKILLGHKKPIFSGNEVIGTLHNFVDMTHGHILDISRFLEKENNRFKRKQFSYIILDSNEKSNLTKRQQVCLFYLLRGYTYKEVAKVLGIGGSTVQAHIGNIKKKFNVESKSQLIEYAMHRGLMSMIPKEIFMSENMAIECLEFL
jgi:DNA-binding CsgD family transcriptional regulator